MKLKMGLEYSDKTSWFQYPSTLCSKKNFLGLQIKNPRLRKCPPWSGDTSRYFQYCHTASRNFFFNFFWKIVLGSDFKITIFIWSIIWNEIDFTKDKRQNCWKMHSKLLFFKITQVLEKHEKSIFTIHNLAVAKQNVHN